MFIEPFYVLALGEETIEDTNHRIIYRPGTLEFLTKLSEHFDILLYSSRDLHHLKQIQRHLDPNNTLIKGVYDHSQCCKTESGKLIKSLDYFFGLSRKDSILLDYKPQNIREEIPNSVLMLYWDKLAPEDQELTSGIVDFLIEIGRAADVRIPIRQNINYYDYLL